MPHLQRRRGRRGRAAHRLKSETWSESLGGVTWARRGRVGKLIKVREASLFEGVASGVWFVLAGEIF